MELHSPAAAKRLWKFLRIAFLTMRKGLISKRKLLMDMNLMMKRGKIMGKFIGSAVFFHHHQRPSRGGHGVSLQDYEFSCTNTPNPVFFHAKRRHNHHYFPCLGSLVEGDETPGRAVVPKIECSQEMIMASPLSVGASGESEEIDDAAEDFIRRFYEQLRVQSRIALIEYQEIEHQEMLERGH